MDEERLMRGSGREREKEREDMVKGEGQNELLEGKVRKVSSGLKENY